MTNRYTTIKYCALSLLLLLVFLLQGTRVISPTIFGFSLDLFPFLIGSIALLEGPYTAGALGFAAGMLCTLISPSPDGALAIYYSVFGVLCGLYGQTYMRPVLPSGLMLGALGAFGLQFFSYIFYYGLVYRLSPVPIFVDFVGDCLLSLIPGAILFFLTRKLCLHFTMGGDQ